MSDPSNTFLYHRDDATLADERCYFVGVFSVHLKDDCPITLGRDW